MRFTDPSITPEDIALMRAALRIEAEDDARRRRLLRKPRWTRARKRDASAARAGS